MGEGNLSRLLLFLGRETSEHQGNIRDGIAQTVSPAATLRIKLLIKLTTSQSHSMLTQGQPVLSPPYNARRLSGQYQF